jgi:hypothetical protein
MLITYSLEIQPGPGVRCTQSRCVERGGGRLQPPRRCRGGGDGDRGLRTVQIRGVVPVHVNEKEGREGTYVCDVWIPWKCLSVDRTFTIWLWFNPLI